MEELIKVLDKAWENGFFYNIRYGVFKNDEYLELKLILENCHIDDSVNTLDKNLVRLLWMIPLFISWQKDILIKKGLDESTFLEMETFFQNICDDILGLP